MPAGWRQHLRSTPMRLALGLVALITMVSVVSLGASYLVVSRSLEQTIRADLTQEAARFQAAPSATAIAALAAAEAATMDPEIHLLSYVAPDGTVYGNATLRPDAEGFVQLTNKSQDGGNADDTFIAYSEPLMGGRLTIARARAQIEDLGEMFLIVFIFSLLPTAFAGLGGGLLIARRAERRLAAIATTLEKLTTGDLAARVPDLGRHRDDLSLIGAKIDRMAGAQEASVSALRQVSADIAHDLKTPIQRVSVLLAQLRERPGLSDADAALVERASAETSAIAATFQSLLQIAQIEGGSPRARFAPLDIAALCRTFVEVYQPSAEDSGHLLAVTDATPRQALVMGDKALIGQVLANLIENALRHTPKGSCIEIAVRPEKDIVALSVADTGPGIPAAERRKVLRRLYRLERSRTTPGSGLGLSLVSVIAALHDAPLSLEDAGPGLLVRLEFPKAGPDKRMAAGAAPI